MSCRRCGAALGVMGRSGSSTFRPDAFAGRTRSRHYASSTSSRRKAADRLTSSWTYPRGSMAIRIYRTDSPYDVPEGPVNLYVLLDETTGTCFYAGITSDTMRRSRQHWHSLDSSARGRLRSVLASGGDCSMIVVAAFETRREALSAEKALHEAHPGLMGARKRETENG